MVRARQGENRVAIKIIRTKFEVMRESGLKELQIVGSLNQADPLDKKFIVRLVESFEHNKHLCLVFESLHLNLRQVLAKFSNNVGLSIEAVKLYGFQLFTSLAFLENTGLVHADLKPDNIMITEDKRKIKLCDFGSCLTPKEVE